MAWFSIAYITGILFDKPLWVQTKVAETNDKQVVPYFAQNGSLAINLDQPFVSFWFDDAWLSQYLKAYPILKEKNYPGVMAVPVNAVDTNNYMNWAQLKVIQKDGWQITNHSLSHNCEMQTWAEDKIAYEYKTSKLILWKNGLASDIFVTPCGVDSPIMLAQAEKQFMGYRTVNPGFNDPKNFSFYGFKVKNIDDKTTVAEMKGWIDEAKKNNLWLILVFHKIGDAIGEATSDEFNTSTSDFKAVVDYVSASNINVVVPQQIMASQK